MYYILFILYLILVGLDQLTKHLMFVLSQAQIGYSIPFIGDVLRWTYVENHGGIFGSFQGNIAVFTIISTVLIAYLIYSEWKNFLEADLVYKIGVIFIASGATGNMLDRYIRGFVIDMIDFHSIWQFIFNVADMYIHIGIYILVLNYVYKKVKDKNESKDK